MSAKWRPCVKDELQKAIKSIHNWKNDSQAYAEAYERIWGNKQAERGHFRWCKETKKWLPVKEWFQKYGDAPKPKAPAFFISHFEAFQSPVTGRIINNKREHQYDLDASGCRVYEGRESEQREADRYNKYKEERFEKEISETVDQTAHEIEHGYRTPKESPETLTVDWE